MADFAEFNGPSYNLPSVQVQSERTVNWRLEPVPNGKNKFSLLRQPGLNLFSDAEVSAISGSCRGFYSLNNHLFAVVGTHMIEILSDGSIIDYTTSSGISIVDDGRRVWMDSNSDQLAIVSGGHLYILAGVLTEVTVGLYGTPETVAFLDGYFILTFSSAPPSAEGSQQFQISALNDGTTWDASDISSAESRPDFILAAIRLREEVWMFGSQTIQPFYTTQVGIGEFPFQSNQSAVIDTGIMARDSLLRIAGRLFWLGVNETGHGTIYTNEGYSPKAVSNYDVESQLNRYSDLPSAYAYGYQESGHICYRISFPGGDEQGLTHTWEYDLTTDQWCEVPYWNTATGSEEMHLGSCSAVCFDKILVGSRRDGKIYEMKETFFDDDGDIIRRLRRAPHLSKNKKRIFYNRFELDGNVGIGLNVPSDQPYYNPQALLRWSDDGGKTWSDDYPLYFGPMGEHYTIPFIQGLGSGRDRVFELVCTDPVDWAIASARLDFTVGVS